MNERELPGKVVRTHVVEGYEVRREAARNVANRAQVLVTWHSNRMKSDPEYRAAVQHLTKMLASQPGRVGEAARRVLAGYTTLARVL